MITPSNSNIQLYNAFSRLSDDLKDAITSIDAAWLPTIVDFYRLHKIIKHSICSDQQNSHEMQNQHLTIQNHLRQTFMSSIGQELNVTLERIYKRFEICKDTFDDLTSQHPTIFKTTPSSPRFLQPQYCLTFAYVLWKVVPDIDPDLFPTPMINFIQTLHDDSFDPELVSIFRQFVQLCYEIDQLRKSILLNAVLFWKSVYKYDKHSGSFGDAMDAFLDILSKSIIPVSECVELMLCVRSVYENLIRISSTTPSASMIRTTCNHCLKDVPYSYNLACEHSFCFSCLVKSRYFGKCCSICKEASYLTFQQLNINNLILPTATIATSPPLPTTCPPNQQYTSTRPQMQQIPPSAVALPLGAFDKADTPISCTSSEQTSTYSSGLASPERRRKDDTYNNNNKNNSSFSYAEYSSSILPLPRDTSQLNSPRRTNNGQKETGGYCNSQGYIPDTPNFLPSLNSPYSNPPSSSYSWLPSHPSQSPTATVGHAEQRYRNSLDDLPGLEIDSIPPQEPSGNINLGTKVHSVIDSSQRYTTHHPNPIDFNAKPVYSTLASNGLSSISESPVPQLMVLGEHDVLERVSIHSSPLSSCYSPSGTHPSSPADTMQTSSNLHADTMQLSRLATYPSMKRPRAVDDYNDSRHQPSPKYITSFTPYSRN
jgi:hypothetical protein